MSSRSISTIKTGDGAEPIEVRIIRKWIPYGIKDECCYLLLDKQGFAIEACGNKRDKAYFEAKMTLQSCYKITGYLSEKPRKSYNVVPHPATIRLARGTSFLPIDTNGFPLHYFNFFPFDRLLDRLDIHFLLTDYIGRFDSITSDTVTPSGKHLLKFMLEDTGDNFIEVALWEEVAQAVDRNILTQQAFPCIVAVTGMKVTEFQHLQLSSTASTHIYINPDVHDAHRLAERMKAKYGDIPANDMGRTTIRQLLQMNPSQNFERRFTCLASITDFIEGRAWFYKGCVRCNKKLTPRSDDMVCGDHPHEKQPKFIYCIAATIADDTGTTTATLFDAAVMSLVQTECHTLVVQEGFSDPKLVPLPIQATKGVTRVFQLQFNNRNQPGSTRFLVNQILEPNDMPQPLPTNIPQEPPTAPAVMLDETQQQQLTSAESPKAHPFDTTAVTVTPPAENKTENLTATPPKNIGANSNSKHATPTPRTPAIRPPAKRQISGNQDESPTKKTHHVV